LPPLHNGRKDLARVAHDEDGRWLSIQRGDDNGAATFTGANLGDAPVHIRLPDGAWRLALSTEASMPASAAGGAAVTFPPSTAAIYERVDLKKQ
jgi:hypothetical protein